jgi:hypothetical protein
MTPCPASFSTEMLSRVPGSPSGQTKSIRSGHTASTDTALSFTIPERRLGCWSEASEPSALARTLQSAGAWLDALRMALIRGFPEPI